MSARSHRRQTNRPTFNLNLKLPVTLGGARGNRRKRVGPEKVASVDAARHVNVDTFKQDKERGLNWSKTNINKYSFKSVFTNSKTFSDSFSKLIFVIIL
jgi:hypothetical protein